MNRPIDYTTPLRLAKMLHVALQYDSVTKWSSVIELSGRELAKWLKANKSDLSNAISAPLKITLDILKIIGPKGPKEKNKTQIADAILMTGEFIDQLHEISRKKAA